MKFIVVLVGQARTFGASGRFHLKSLEGLPKGACRSTSTSAHTFHCETWNSDQRSSLWGCSSIVSRDVNSVSCNVSCSILTDDMSLSFTTDYFRSSTFANILAIKVIIQRLLEYHMPSEEAPATFLYRHWTENHQQLERRLWPRH